MTTKKKKQLYELNEKKSSNIYCKDASEIALQKISSTR